MWVIYCTITPKCNVNNVDTNVFSNTVKPVELQRSGKTFTSELLFNFSPEAPYNQGLIMFLRVPLLVSLF